MLMMMLSLAATAVPEMTSAGPYSISFDLNTTLNHTIQQKPTWSPGGFSQHPLIIMTNNQSWAGVAVYDYNNLTDSTILTQKDLMFSAMALQGYRNITIADATIDGVPAVIASGIDPSGESAARAWYWKDSQSCQCGPVSVGKTRVEVVSSYPVNMTSSLLQTIHVQRNSTA
ncbi:MAG TPA: hypothetical protein VN455_13330 [Methanotrichaceae archaeon]|nr:hypothetical protein [Methanotrichaceae archaeon]